MSYTRTKINKSNLVTIELPKKIPIQILSVYCDDHSDSTSYNLFLNSPQFDPNMESSPPNTFMQNLHERMGIYYTSNEQNLNVNK